MSKKLIIPFVAGICFFSSCCAVKKIQKPVIITKDTATAVVPFVVVTPEKNEKEDSFAVINENYKRIIANRINVTTFSAKADVHYEDADGKKVNATAHLRMYKDSAIWVSVTGPLGIEGLRAYITADSVKVLDKQNKVYIERSVSYLQEVTELPLSLGSLEDLLLGNPVFLDSNIVSYSKTGGTISLQSMGEFFNNLFTIGETDKLLQNSKLSDPDAQETRSCYLVYTAYDNSKGVNFSTERDINVTAKKKLDIKLDFKQYDFNETLSFPFSIPKNYKHN